MIKASITFGVRPTAMILGKDSKKPWDKWDLLLAEAFQILENERCPQCGLPVYICHNDDNDIQFRVEEETCASMVKKESHEESVNRRRGKKGPPKGVVLRPQPFSVSGADLSSFREPYYSAQAKKREALTEKPPS